MTKCCERDTDGDGNCDIHHAVYCTCPVCQAKNFNNPPEHIMQFFEYAHLPKHLQEISRPFGELARTMMMILPKNPERTVALRKLLESKDAAVRASIAK